MEESEELGPAAAYSASVAEWLNQAYHAHMIQVREYRTQWVIEDQAFSRSYDLAHLPPVLRIRIRIKMESRIRIKVKRRKS
jgi:hypothetical protein